MSWLLSAALMKDFEKSRCSPERAAEYSEGRFLDGEQCAQLNVMPTLRMFWHNDKMIKSLKPSLFGLTWSLLTESRGAELLTWYLAGFHVKTSASLEKEKELEGKEADCGVNSLGWFQKFDHDSHSWKTRQTSLIEGLESSWVTWHQWGMMRGGESFVGVRLVSCITGNASSFWPTPQRIDEDFCRMKVETAIRKGKQKHVTTELIKLNGKRYPLPSFGEALMGFPNGFSRAGESLGMRKFQKWLRSHGERSPRSNKTLQATAARRRTSRAERKQVHRKLVG